MFKNKHHINKHYIAIVIAITLMMAGCAKYSTGVPVPSPTRSFPTHSPFLPTSHASPTSITATTPTETKPGPPPGYVEPSPEPTATTALSPSSIEWKTIELPPPKGSRQIVPSGVSLPNVSLTMPKRWSFVRHPGAYFIGPDPDRSPPVLVIGPSMPFANLGETAPKDMEGFAKSLAQLYKRFLNVPGAQTKRVDLDGGQGIAVFLPSGEACMELYVPLNGRFDVTYKLTFMHTLCTGTRGDLTDTGKTILKSLKLKP